MNVAVLSPTPDRTDTLVRSSICSETIQLSIVVDDRDTRAPIRSRNQPRTLEPRSERIDETTVGTVSSAVPIASVWSTASGAIQSGAVTTSASTPPAQRERGNYRSIRADHPYSGATQAIEKHKRELRQCQRIASEQRMIERITDASAGTYG